MCSDPVILAPASGLRVGVLGPHCHQAGHLVLGQPDLAAAEVGQRQVSDLERNCLSSHAGSSVSSAAGLVRGWARPAPIRSHNTTVRQGSVRWHVQGRFPDKNL